MSFFNAIKRSLGFGEDIEDDLLSDSADTAERSELPVGLPQSASIETPQMQAVETDDEMTARIFEHVVATFNKALPDFLSRSVNPEAQRKELYDSLDSSLKNYLNELGELTRKQCEARMAADQTAMRAEMDTLRTRTKEVEQQRFDIKQQQLSADRQRRALNERVHDLENQLSATQAEREQFDLENKSLVNKLKVAAVHEKEVEELRAELTAAQETIIRLKNNSGNPATDADNSRVDELEAENARLVAELEAASEKDRISSEMFNGLQSNASAARAELETAKAEIKQLKVQLKEAQQFEEEIRQFDEQMTRIKEVIDKRDRKIENLKETCTSLRAENASLRDTIATNLKAYADTEAALKDRIAELESDPAAPIIPLEVEATVEADVTESEAETPKISDCDLAAIEESFDSSDWMRSDPPNTPSMRTGVSEAEFGYQAPVRKTPRQDNDAQLSLF